MKYNIERVSHYIESVEQERQAIQKAVANIQALVESLPSDQADKIDAIINELNTIRMNAG